jgi:hypothetical protein
VVDVLSRELGDQPELLDRVLVALANTAPSMAAASRAAAG